MFVQLINAQTFLVPIGVPPPVFSSADSAYQISWPSAVYVSECVYLDINQGGTNRNR